jgi:uncharacterized protein (DUF427 family)
MGRHRHGTDPRRRDRSVSANRKGDSAMPELVEDQDVGVDRPDPSQRIRVQPWPRRVRAVLGNVAVADSTRVLLLLEKGHLPVYYFPASDVRTDLLEPTDKHTRCPYKGEASYWTVKVGDRQAANAVWSYLDPLPERTDIKGYMAFYWDRVDSWWEEDDEVFVHPRDPYHRVDVLNSSRHVRVEIAGQTVADTQRPRLLFETNLPTRYYIPKADVRMDLLEPTDTATSCPYKGQARYWSFQSGDSDQAVKDAAWSYPAPIPECPKIENLVAFFNERVDLYVDGELQPRPKTPWS